MDEPTLFPLPSTLPAVEAATAGADPRVQRPNRIQVEWRPFALDHLLAPDHRARLVWRFVEQLNLEPLYARIEAVAGAPGRPPIDPAILLGLWLYATLEGVGSPARSIACAASTSPISGCVAGSASTTTRWRTFAS